MRRRFHPLRRAVHCPGLLEELGERLQGARLHGGGRGHPHRRASRVVEHPGGQKPCIPILPGDITAQDARVAFTDSNLDRSTVPRMPAVVNDANLGFVCSVSGTCWRIERNTPLGSRVSMAAPRRAGSPAGATHRRDRPSAHPSPGRARGWPPWAGEGMGSSGSMSDRDRDEGPRRIIVPLHRRRGHLQLIDCRRSASDG